MYKLKIKLILNSYKNGKIDEYEAIRKIEELMSRNRNKGKIASQITWDDDGKLRIVAFIGTKLLENIPKNNTFEIRYVGKALNVDCRGSLTCQNIEGSATAGSWITCDTINGNATAGSHIRCKKIGGNAIAGSGIHLVSTDNE